MRLWRYCLAGLLFNWAAFVFWYVLPIRALDFHASSTQLALLPTASSLVYVLNSLFSGGLPARVPGSLLALLPPVFLIAVFLLPLCAGSLWGLFLFAPFMGFACSFSCPTIKGPMGAEGGSARLEKV